MDLSQSRAAILISIPPIRSCPASVPQRFQITKLTDAAPIENVCLFLRGIHHDNHYIPPEKTSPGSKQHKHYSSDDNKQTDTCMHGFAGTTEQTTDKRGYTQGHAVLTTQLGSTVAPMRCSRFTKLLSSY